MADPTPTPNPQPTPKSKRQRSPVNQHLVDELDLAEQLAGVAQKAAYKTALAGEEIDGAFITGLTGKIAEADKLLGSATDDTADKQSTTKQEQALKDALHAQIQAIQQRAKRKYAEGDPLRAKYFIGERIESNRATLERATRAILQQLATDTLPGLKPADGPALQAALDAYVKVQGDQTGTQSDATTARSQLAAKVKAVADLRRQIQYAADTLWPATQATNAGIRTEFKISATKALK